MKIQENSNRPDDKTSGISSNMSEEQLTNKGTHTQPIHMTDEYQLAEAEFGRAIGSVLDTRAQQLNASTAQALAAARERAVAKLAVRQAQSVQANGSVLAWLGHQMGDYVGHHRAMSTAMVAGVMALTFFAAQQFDLNNNLENSDAFLLASELPPEAFADKGFDTWLDSNASY